MSTEVAHRQISSDELASAESFEDVLAILGEHGVDSLAVASDTEVLGNGFEVLQDEEKDRLVGVPFMAISWKFGVGDTGKYVTILLMTKEGKKYIITDGSTGIFNQLDGLYEKTGRTAGLLVNKGLLRSDYRKTFVDDKSGRETERMCHTYYLNTSA